MKFRVKLLGKKGKLDRDPQRNGEAVTGRKKDNRSDGKQGADLKSKDCWNRSSADSEGRGQGSEVQDWKR